jgi:hypothetical protein
VKTNIAFKESVAMKKLTSVVVLASCCLMQSALANPFQKTLELQGIHFDISSPNDSSLSTLTIKPSGLKGDNSTITQEVDGTVTGAEIADLDANGFPEIYVYVTSAGSGSYGSLAAYASNKNQSLTQIYLPPVAENAKAAKGYMGHDEFAVVEGTFVQRFPIYLDADTNAKPSGKLRQLQYKLKSDESGWLLKLDRTIELDAPSK